MTTELVAIEQTALTPAEFAQELEYAHIKAKSLTKIVEEQKLFAMINGKKHLLVEAWQTIGMGYGLSAAVKETEILCNQLGVETGARAGVVIYNKHGVVVGGAVAYCMCGEGDWGNRNTNQRISMAGTRATSKALRLLLSWVVVLAGYEPTPAEEMTRDIPALPRSPAHAISGEDLGTCPLHPGTPWLKNRLGTLYHKHGQDNELWCNPKAERRQDSKDALESAHEATAETSQESMTLSDLEGEVQQAGMSWKDFESKVLQATWADFIGRQGASPSVALARLNTYLDLYEEVEENNDV